MNGLDVFLILVGLGAGLTACAVMGYIWDDLAQAASRYLQSFWE
jgi:hypothetical protein